MQEEFGLHDLAVEDARHGHQRPKIEEYGKSIFAVLHTSRCTAATCTGRGHIFVGRTTSFRCASAPSRGSPAVRAATENEPELLRHGARVRVLRLVDAIVDRYFPIEDAVEVELEQLEAHIFERQLSRANSRRSTIEAEAHGPQPRDRSAARSDRQARAAARADGVPGTQDYFRDVVDHLERLSTTWIRCARPWRPR
jgi:magnesium transporter